MNSEPDSNHDAEMLMRSEPKAEEHEYTDEENALAAAYLKGYADGAEAARRDFELRVLAGVKS